MVVLGQHCQAVGTNFIGCLYGYSLNENDSAINVSSPLEIIKNIK